MHMLAAACCYWRPVGLSDMLLRRVLVEKTQFGVQNDMVCFNRRYQVEQQLNNTEWLAV